MARYEQLTVTKLTVDGELINKSGAIRILLTDGSGNALLATGASVPSGVKGYAKGCLFIETDAASGSAIYTNVGTAASCNFSKIAVS